MAQTEEDSSSSDPDSEAAEDEREKLVVKTLSAYYNEFGGSSLESPKHLHLSLQSNNSCLICLSTVKRVQAVWSCKLCYTMFHLVCIQQWAKDGILVKNSTLSEEFFPSLPLMWTCPKCRGEYHRTDVPVVYLCFCGKQVFCVDLCYI